MKTLLWIAIISVTLTALVINSASSSNSISTPAQKECDCGNLKILQTELRNAIRLQQNYRNEVAVLRPMELGASQGAFKQFAEGSAAKAGLEPVPNYQGAESFVFTPRGYNMGNYQNFSAAQQCEMSDGTKLDFDKVLAAAACAGIARAVQAHEQVHINKCISAGGYPGYIGRHGADMAQEEVEAYAAEISALRAEIAKVLENADVHVIVDVNTRMQMPANPLYSAINITNHADIPMSRVSATSDFISMQGEDKQQTNGSIEGNCRFTSGLPSYLPAHATVETDGTEAKVSYNVEGTAGKMTMECTLGGQTGRGMSMPVPISGNNKGDFALVFENGATKEFDQGSGEAAQIMARGGAKMSGKGIVKLVFCNSNK